MKMNRYLWLLCLLLMMQLVTAQPAKNISADPAAQLRELTLLPRLTMPSVKMPALRESFQKPQMPGYNIKKAIEVAKLKCPFLTARSTLFLNGERSSNEQVGLQWKTKNTFYSNAFEVERSLGDTMHFEKVNFLWAKGNNIKEKYQLPDNNDYHQSSYYRIKMILTDGTFTYSNIAKVKGYEDFFLYPNPSSSQFRIIVSSNTFGTGKIALVDASGKTVQQSNFTVTEGSNQKDVDIATLPTGVYMVMVTMPGNQLRLKKLVKN
jgi:hypothetical protein